jgi:hypothetical protein
LQGLCHYAIGNQTIKVNLKMPHYRQQAREKLNTEEGTLYQKNHAGM